MNENDPRWELIILDAAPELPVTTFNSLKTGDIDADGKMEVVVGGDGGLFWYRPATYERGVIAKGVFSTGLALEDIDSDGRLEIITGKQIQPDNQWLVICYKYQPEQLGWEWYVLDATQKGEADQIVFGDVDKDNRLEMIISNSQLGRKKDIHIYKSADNAFLAWQGWTVAHAIDAEGISLADLDGDGYQEIIIGPMIFHICQDGSINSAWKPTRLVTDLREKCLSLVMDINQDGKPDIVLVEAKYTEACLAWFENKVSVSNPMHFVEHIIEGRFQHASSLARWGDQSFLVTETPRQDTESPYNFNARLVKYSSSDHGQKWLAEVIDQGSGTQQAVVVGIDADGEVEIIGMESIHPRVQMWRNTQAKLLPYGFRHRFLDQNKPYTGVEILAEDVDENGMIDVICGSWWYQNPTWERFEIPNIYQVLTAYDLDRDGRREYIAIRKNPSATPGNWYEGLSTELVWIKPVDLANNQWEEHYIGTGKGDWPHGSLVAPVLPNGQLALLTAYHSAFDQPDYPEIFEIPMDPTISPWPKRTLVQIRYWENFEVADIDGDGRLDIVAGVNWLRNQGDGTFENHRITPDVFDVERCVVADMNGDGRMDILVGESRIEIPKQYTPPTRLVWYENPGNSTDSWEAHVVDLVRYPHSIAVADLDNDGKLEIICGEHDPFHAYNTRCRLFVYKRAVENGTVWKRMIIDDRFEHHCGARLMDLGNGKKAILSHAWSEGNYVHLWEPEE